MIANLENSIEQLSLKMRQLKAIQQETSLSKTLTERDEMILILLAEKGPLAVSQIANSGSDASFSTISMNVTKLWRDKLVSKTVLPENQRVTIVELTEQGRQIAQLLKDQRAERFKMLLQALNLTDEETAVLMKILTRAIPFFDSKLGPDEGIK